MILLALLIPSGLKAEAQSISAASKKTLVKTWSGVCSAKTYIWPCAQKGDKRKRGRSEK